jgi:hypothetical protein
MKVEYDFEELKLSERDLEALRLSLFDITQVNNQIRDIINRRGQDGWEALYPFSVPQIWFKRVL